MTNLRDKMPVVEQGRGNYPDYFPIFFSGEATGIGTISQTLWEPGGVYPYFTSGAQALSVESSDANDTAGGTGARTVLLGLLDSAHNRFFELVTLNGTTPVLTIGEAVAINSAFVVDHGAGNSNAGNIEISLSVDTGLVGFINAGDSMMRAPFQTVPAGKQWIPLGFMGGSGATDDMEINATTRSLSGLNSSVTHNFVAGPYPFQNYAGISFPEKQLMIVTAKSLSAVNKRASVIIQAMEVDYVPTA